MKNPVMWLKEARTRAGLSTYETARRAGISQSHYSMIENGARGCPVGTAKKISSVFGFDWQKFYAECKETPTDERTA